jgi:HK97 family phage major capsid protein
MKMPKNKDFVVNAEQLEITQRISNAAKEGDTEAFEAGMQDMFQNIHDQIIAEAASIQDSADAAALAQRGVRILTSEERTFYNGLIESMKTSGTSNPMMALTNTDKTFPLTIINQVMEDMKQDHPLLDVVDSVAVTGLTKILVNTDAGDNATWNALDTAITKEITSGFDEIDLTQKKLSAWMPIGIDMLELGANWLDTYIRTCLSEALAIGFENAIVTGTGNNMPIGMDRSVADDVTVVGGVYPQKTAVAVTDFGRASYGSLVARLAKNQHNKPRAVRGLIMVVNPFDYYSLVMPATTLMTPEGKFVNDVLPVPTQIIQSVAVTQGEAILGMGKRYFLGVGGKRGIQFSDDYKFLEDQRYYKIVAYANGRPKDDNAFLRLDISNLEPTYLEVREAQ